MSIKKQAYILQTIRSMIKRLIYYIAPFCLKIILFFIFITCKWKVYNHAVFERAQKKSRPILICSWHNSFLLAARYFKKISLSIWAVSSTHRDSQIMAKILDNWNFNLIKGSSTRGWNNVLKSMMKIFSSPNSIIAVTNDGPKGPPFVAKRGSVALALKKNVQIIALSAIAKKHWSLPSWDKTIIPQPFSTIYIQFAEPFQSSPNPSVHEQDAIGEYMNNNLANLKNKVCE